MRSGPELSPLLPDKERQPRRCGRPFRPAREVRGGVLWVQSPGARWPDLPPQYPPFQTCHRRYQHWCEYGQVSRILTVLGEELLAKRKLGLDEAYIDATFVSAKKGATKLARPSEGCGTKIMAIADQHGLPLALYLESANPHEVKLVQQTIAARFVTALPKLLIGDKAYDSDPLDRELAAQGIEMIAPHWMSRKQPLTQDGRKLRRYRHRWKVERLFA